VVCAEFFPNNMWPNFEEYKQELEKWLNLNHPNYLQELGDREWINNFSGKHHSLVIIVYLLLIFKYLILILFYNRSCEK
jgi:hypothetical protein